MTTKTTILSLFTIALLSTPMALADEPEGVRAIQQLRDLVDRIQDSPANETLDHLVDEVFGAAEGQLCVGTHTLTATSAVEAIATLMVQVPELATGQAASLYVLPDPRYPFGPAEAEVDDLVFKILILQQATSGQTCYAHEESQANGTPWIHVGGGRLNPTEPGEMWSATIEDWKRWLQQ